METNAVKKLKDIRPLEYYLFEWVDISKLGANEREFIRGRERTPDESSQARLDWDMWVKSRRIWDKREKAAAEINSGIKG